MRWAPIALVEMPEFAEHADKILSEGQRYELLLHIAEDPDCGAVIPGTGGVRKLRWGLSGRGKRGGVRVIYYYYDQNMPILLLALFVKNVKADLS